MSIDNGVPQIPPPSPKPILRSLAQTNEPPPPLRPCTDSSGDARNVTLASDQSSTPDYALQSQFRQQREFLEGFFGGEKSMLVSAMRHLSNISQKYQMG